MWKNTRNVFCKTRAARNTGSKGNIDRSKCALAATDAMRAARNSCSKGNIDHSNSALAATDKIYVYILRSKCGKTPEMFSIKRVRFVILTRKGISIIAIARWQQQTRYMCIFFVLNVENHK